MTTRVDPELYRDTPIFRQMLRDRKGRWPGIPLDELTSGVLLDKPSMYRVQPVLSDQTPRTRPYTAKEFPVYDPEETTPMPLPHVAEG